MLNDIKYKKVFSKRKTIGIKIDKDGSLILSLPLNTSDEEIEKVLLKHEAWIRSKVNMVASRKHLEKGTILYKGNVVNIIICKQKFLKRNFACLTDNKLIVSVKDDEYTQKTIVSWLKNEVELEVYKFIKKYNDYFKIKPTEIRIKEYKSRWGCCMGDNRLFFNWRLIMAPEGCMEYVVVHEMCHLIHKNHSKKFWQLVEKLMPDYLKYHNWLKDNGYLLYEI